MISSKLTLLCVLFKPSKIPDLSYLLPVQSGAAISNWQSAYAKDNTEENISLKNERLSEITSLYWAWRNNKFGDSQYVGLCHYRRYFLTYKPLFSRTGFYRYKQLTSIFEKRARRLPELVFRLLSQYDIITSKPFSARISDKEKVSLKKQYAFYHYAEDWELLRETIREVQPSYLKSFEQYEQQGHFLQFNMFIANKEFFNEYMQWLMSILEPLENVLPQREDRYQNRAIAFLSERMLGLYIHHHQLKATWLPVGYLEEP